MIVTEKSNGNDVASNALLPDFAEDDYVRFYSRYFSFANDCDD